MLLQPKNWAVFQHYKDRCPPWIKLHRDLLNDRVFMCLPLASKALAPLLWLLASESKDGTFDGSLDELVFRLHITPKDYQDGVKPLIDKGFFVVASGVLAECYQDAIPETEREREGETKRETKAKKETVIAVCPINVEEAVWADFLALRKAKKAPVTVTALAGIKREADKANWSLARAITECVERGWTGFKAEWVAPKPTFAQQAADVARTTVPSQHAGRDPVLIKIEQERLRAVPPTVEQLEKMAALRRSIAK
jgi:hypothetical protein